MGRAYVVWTAALAIGALLSSAPSSAAPRRPNAAQLTAAGERLLAKNRFADACAKFDESRTIAATPRALLGLARCNAGLKKTATALRQYKEALDLAKRRRDTAAERSARRGIVSLEPVVSRVEIRLEPGADIPDLEVRQGDTIVPRERLGVAVPVDPGEHEFTATAPGRQPWGSRKLVPARSNLTVFVPILPPLPNEPALPAAVTTTSEPPPAADVPPAPARSPAEPPPSPPRVLVGMDTYFGTYSDPTAGPGVSMMYFPSAVWLASPRVAIFVRAAALQHLPSRTRSVFALGNVAVGAGYAFDLAPALRLTPLVVAFAPVGTGGGSSPDPEVLNAIFQARPIGGPWFMPDYLSAGGGAKLEWSLGRARLQLSQEIFYSIRLGGIEKDATLLGVLTRPRLGYALPFGVEPYAELAYVRFLTEPYPACCTPSPDPAFRDHLSGALGVGAAFGRVSGQLEYGRLLDAPGNRASVQFVKVGLGVAL